MSFVFLRRAPVAHATILICAIFLAPIVAFAQANSYINGTVTNAGVPVADAQVVLSGGNATQRATTNAQGRFSFPALTVGTYDIVVTRGALSTRERVDLTSSGATIGFALDPLREIGRTAITGRTPISGRSGADVVLNQQALTRSPHSGSLPEILLQVPGAARGANGVVHINGDHGDINYVVDGVPLPIEINRAIGTEFDPSNIGFAEVLQGAYPAQYGERFGAVVNIGTLSNPGPAGYRAEFKAGSFGVLDSTLQFHGPLAKGGSYLASMRNGRDGRALDPPNATGSPQNAGSNSVQLVRITLPRGNDFANLTFSHTLQSYQIPVDVAGISGTVFPSGLNNNERQDDIFASFQYRHPIGDHGALSFGPSVRRSRLLDTGDYANDTALALRDPQAPPNATPAGSTSALCANAVSNGLYLQSSPTGALSNCALSIFADRTSLDYRFNVDYSLRSPHHEIRAGAIYDATKVTKAYDIALQPNNYFSANRFDVFDNAPNIGHTENAYVQDSWKMGSTWTLDYGLRADAFQIFSSNFRDAEFALSPRMKLTHTFTPRSNLYAYYGRYFTPYSFENVSPSAAQCLNPPPPRSSNPSAVAITSAQCASTSGTGLSLVGFDLRAQRDSVYEIGGQIPIAKAQLGFRLMQKNSTNIIDDVAVGLTNLHQDINYGIGRITVATLFAQLPLARGGRAYISASRDQAEVKNCLTQLLAQCIGQAADFIPADHDQRYSASGGLLLNDHRNGYFALDGEYGSGLTTAPSNNTIDTTVAAAVFNPYCLAAPGGVGSNACKIKPHVTFDAEKGVELSRGVTAALGVTNLLNNRYLVTYQNAQGFHYARPRSIFLKLNITR